MLKDPDKRKKKKKASTGRTTDDANKLIKELSKPKKESSRSKSSKKSASKPSGYKSKSGKTLSEKQLKRSLEPLREQLKVLVDQANKRANDILVAGKPSRAMEEARRSWEKMPSRRVDETLFKSDLKTRKQINKEFARVHSFLNDYTSTLQGADDLTTNIHRLEGSWGKAFNTEVRDDALTSKTFELYRRVVEAAGGWERAVGLIKGKESLIGYGSENLINNIYDMVENNYDDADIMSIALEQVEAGIRAYEEMAEKQVSDYDYGVVFEDESAMERKNFFMWRRRNGRG